MESAKALTTALATLDYVALRALPGALAVLQDKGQREAITRLFYAYFRVAEGRDLTGTVLQLDLPAESNVDSTLPPRGGVALPPFPLKRSVPRAQPDPKRYYFSARFTKNSGWVVYATLKPEYRIMSKEVEGNAVCEMGA